MSNPSFIYACVFVLSVYVPVRFYTFTRVNSHPTKKGIEDHGLFFLYTDYSLTLFNLRERRQPLYFKLDRSPTRFQTLY